MSQLEVPSACVTVVLPNAPALIVPSEKSVSGMAVPAVIWSMILVPVATRPLMRMFSAVGTLDSPALLSRDVPRSTMGSSPIVMSSR